MSKWVVGKRLKPLAVGSGQAGPDKEGVPERNDASWRCEGCPLRNSPICSNVVDHLSEDSHSAISRHLAKARQTTHRKDQTTDQIYVIKDGWAFRYAITASGRRQILSFLMPGDLMVSPSFYDGTVPYSIQAVTDISYCGFDRDHVKALVMSCTKTSRIFDEFYTEERQLYDGRIVDLGTRSAEERGARFLLEIMRRLDRRGLVHDQMFKLPLKQLHLADALGLTQVHVNRVLKRLRESGMIEWSRGVLTISDMSSMRQIADMR